MYSNFEILVAVDNNNVIGYNNNNNNNIPWYIPEDLKRFQDITKNNIVVMGRKTFESLPNGKLKNRINIVITNNITNKNTESDLIFTNINNFYTIIDNICKNKKIFIIGGSEIYKLFYNNCKIIHLTKVYLESNGSIYFPININDYKIINKSNIFLSKNNNIKYQYYTYEKIHHL